MRATASLAARLAWAWPEAQTHGVVGGFRLPDALAIHTTLAPRDALATARAWHASDVATNAWLLPVESALALEHTLNDTWPRVQADLPAPDSLVAVAHWRASDTWRLVVSFAFESPVLLHHRNTPAHPYFDAFDALHPYQLGSDEAPVTLETLAHTLVDRVAHGMNPWPLAEGLSALLACAAPEVRMRDALAARWAAWRQGHLA